MEYFIKKLKYPSDELVVLCMHSTPADHNSEFEKIINFLLLHFEPMNPKNLEQYYSGTMKNGPYVLFTFDDGLKNNLNAARALQKRGIYAIFFVVPEFIKSARQKEYYLKNIRPVTDPDFDKEVEDFAAMSFEDLRQLQQSGHVIGAHTSTHRMTREMNEAELSGEVIACKESLTAALGSAPQTFCSINNTSASVSARAKKMIAENYDFHFTTFPGLNSAAKNKQLIFRRNIEVNWPLSRIKFALGQADFPRWSSSIQQFRDLA